MINRQVVLASRPKGVAQAEHFVDPRRARRRVGGRPDPGPQRVPVGRAGDARLDRRSRQLFRAGRNRLGHARTRRRRNRRIPPSRLSAGRDRHGLVRLAGNGHRRCDRRRASRGRNRPAALARTWRPRDQRRLCAGRADRNRRTPAGRNCVRFDRRGRGRISRRANRENSWLPHGRRRRRPRKGRAMPRSLRIRRGDRLQGAGNRRSDRGCLPRWGSRLFRQYLGRDQRRGLSSPRGRSARRRLRHRLDLQSGTRGRWGLGSSAICSSSAPERRGS